MSLDLRNMRHRDFDTSCKSATTQLEGLSLTGPGCCHLKLLLKLIHALEMPTAPRAAGRRRRERRRRRQALAAPARPCSGFGTILTETRQFYWFGIRVIRPPRKSRGEVW